MWKRDPFFGGCAYWLGTIRVVGYYSPSDPLEFEGDCKQWTANNVPGKTFPTAETAMDAADAAARRLAPLWERIEGIHNFNLYVEPAGLDCPLFLERTAGTWDWWLNTHPPGGPAWNCAAIGRELAGLDLVGCLDSGLI